MRHPIIKRYRLYLFALMAVYVVLVLLVFPHAKHADAIATRAALAVLSVSPVIAVIWLMVMHVMHSDELEQRLHLMAMSAATGIVAAASLIGGFLNAARVIQVDGDILIWVFPSLCMTYGFARMLFARRYGGSGCG
jgi:hypothetical protein